MRIAFIVGEFPVLSKTAIMNQVTGLIDRGLEVDIYADPPSSDTKTHPDVDKYNLLARTYYNRMPRNRFLRVLKGTGLLFASCYRKPLAQLRSLSVLKYGRQAASLSLLYSTIPLLDKPPYDIIHCHFGPNGVKGVALREIGALQGRLITTFHGYDITRHLQTARASVYDHLFEVGDLFLPISERWRRRLIELGCDSRKTAVHRAGVDCSKFTFVPRRARGDGHTRIVTIGRLVEKKGLEYGIRAVAQLRKTNPTVEYEIVGDGPLREDLDRLTQELDLSGTVKLLGAKQQHEVVEILNSADILLAPSVTSRDGDQEGIPATLMEGMATGSPVVSTRHSGIPELIEDGVSGFLVAERDVDALAERLRHLIEHPEIWPTMGAAGRACVEEHYDLDKLNDRLVEIYHEVLKGDVPRPRQDRV